MSFEWDKLYHYSNMTSEDSAQVIMTTDMIFVNVFWRNKCDIGNHYIFLYIEVGAHISCFTF